MDIRDRGHVEQRTWDIELPGRKKRKQPQRRQMDTVKEDTKMVGGSVDTTKNRTG